MKDADSKAWETYQLSSGMEMSTVRSVAPPSGQILTPTEMHY